MSTVKRSYDIDKEIKSNAYRYVDVIRPSLVKIVDCLSCGRIKKGLRTLNTSIRLILCGFCTLKLSTPHLRIIKYKVFTLILFICVYQAQPVISLSESCAICAIFRYFALPWRHENVQQTPPFSLCLFVIYVFFEKVKIIIVLDVGKVL